MTLFIVVTLFGLWVLQTIVIQLTLPLWGTLFSNGQLALLAAKLAATIVSLSWNYTLYEKLVFAKKEP